VTQVRNQKAAQQKELDSNLAKLNELNAQKQKLSKELALSKFFLKQEYFTQLTQLKNFLKKKLNHIASLIS
jgi:hypothetical protein